MSRITKYLLIHYKANTKLKLCDTRYKIPVASIACSRSVSPFIFCKVDMTVGKVAKIASIDSCLQDHLVSDCLRSLIFFPPWDCCDKRKISWAFEQDKNKLLLLYMSGYLNWQQLALTQSVKRGRREGTDSENWSITKWNMTLTANDTHVGKQKVLKD